MGSVGLCPVTEAQRSGSGHPSLCSSLVHLGSEAQLGSCRLPGGPGKSEQLAESPGSTRQVECSRPPFLEQVAEVGALVHPGFAHRT